MKTQNNNKELLEQLEQLKKENETLKTERVALSEKLSKVKIREVKEFSDYFINEKNEAQKYANLSETKLFFEKHLPDVLKIECDRLNRKLKSKDFNLMLKAKFE